jgi:hypothetical protein
MGWWHHSVDAIPHVASPVSGHCRLTLPALRKHNTKKKDERGAVIVGAPWIWGGGSGPPLRWIWKCHGARRWWWPSCAVDLRMTWNLATALPWDGSKGTMGPGNGGNPPIWRILGCHGWWAPPTLAPWTMGGGASQWQRPCSKGIGGWGGSKGRRGACGWGGSGE